MYIVDYFQVNPRNNKVKHFQIVLDGFISAIKAVKTISHQAGVSYPCVLSGERIVYTA